MKGRLLLIVVGEHVLSSLVCTEVTCACTYARNMHVYLKMLLFKFRQARQSRLARPYQTWRNCIVSHVSMCVYIYILYIYIYILILSDIKILIVFFFFPAVMCVYVCKHVYVRCDACDLRMYVRVYVHMYQSCHHTKCVTGAITYRYIYVCDSQSYLKCVCGAAVGSFVCNCLSRFGLLPFTIAAWRCQRRRIICMYVCMYIYIYT